MNNEFELPTEGVKIYSPEQGWQSAGQPQHEAQDVRPHGTDGTDRPDGPVSPAASAASFEEPVEEVRDDDTVLVAEDPSVQELEVAPAVSAYVNEERLPEADDDGPRYEEIARMRAERTIDDSPLPPALAADQARAQVAQGEAAALAQVGDSLNSLFLALQASAPGTDLTNRGPSWRDVADISRHMEECLSARQEALAQLANIERQIRDTREDLLETLRLLAAMEQQNLEAATVRANISALAANVISKRFTT
jgi:hypothetical protein